MKRAFVLSATAASGAALVASALAVSAAPPASALVQIRGNVLPSLGLLSSRAADPAATMTVGVALAHPDTAGEQALLTRMYTPGSPDFGHYLSAAQVAARFGVPHARTADIVARLRAAGLHVDAPDAFGDYVNASGTVAAVERAFGVTERQYTVSTGHGRTLTFLANTAGPMVPAADGVVTVVGLNTLQRYRTAQDLCTQKICTGSTTPEDLWDVYKEPARYSGQGVTMAVIGEGDPRNLPGYLARQEDKYGLPHTKLTVKCVQHSCGTDTGGDGEWQIDTQASAGMAPHNAGVTLYFAKTILDGDLNNSFVAWAHDAKGPKLASASLGECESSPINDVFTGPLGALNGNTNGNLYSVVAFGNGEQAAIDPVLRSAVLQGKTLFASTGDTGSSCPLVYLPIIGAGNGVLNQGLPEQNYPAVSANAVAVGGTVLYTADNGSSAGTTYKSPNSHTSRVEETAWSFGGGGASLWIPAPKWQHSVAAINQPCLVPNNGAAPGTLCRGVPDVAAQSGDILTNGYSVVGSGGFTSGGGTSLSSPLWMGMWARVQGAAANHNLGFAAPWLYRMGSNAATYARDFYDVTVGGNGIHVATTGWDYTTGWGAPNVAGLIADIDHKH